MRHRKRGRKLGRTSAHRKALLRNLAIALFTHGRIMTTLAKAKEARPYAEKLITLARKGMTARDQGEQERYLHCYRRAISELGDKQIAKKLFDEIAPGYADRPGGYTRILRDAHNRLGDNAPRAVFELVEFEGGERGGAPGDKKRRKRKPGKKIRAASK